MKILIADDNPNIRSLIIQLLSPCIKDCEFLQAEDGLEAIETYQSKHPEIILMDIMMEKLDGLSALKKIRAISEEVCIIIISQLPDSEYKPESISMGADAYLNKENLTQLPVMINKFLTNIQTRRIERTK